jgi:CheY-like chemotaxis protein
MDRAGRRPSATILVVEDDKIANDSFVRMLALEGYAVVAARSVAEAWREIERRTPDAIVLDFHLPEMDGVEFLRQIRGREVMEATPVGVVTGDLNLDEDVSSELRALGAHVHFKPLWMEDLVDLAHRMLAQRGAAPAAISAVGASDNSISRA